VVAAESTWGSLARSLAGNRLTVTALIENPAIDPHGYEPRPVDARLVAGASLVILNGIGYDQWAQRLLEAGAARGRRTLDVGRVVGVAAPANPHRWYAPADVDRVVDAITASYEQLDPAGREDFERLRARLRQGPLAEYHRLIASLRRRFAGVAIGASESIFDPMAQALGLRLITPPGLERAVAEGTDPSAADKRAADRQISTRAIRAWVYNSQNSTPDVARLTESARAAGIPVVVVSETLSPAHTSFVGWQTAQLRQLERALARAR